MNPCKALRPLVAAMLYFAVLFASAQSPSAGTNVNMVSGTDWTTGDPFLQRQNEPSAAVSTRNPLHLLAGANDYRTVDLPGLLGIDERGDAWLGIFKSFDGGQTWQSTLLPGYPLDSSSDGLASPLRGFQAGADPAVRAGTNGLFYYGGIAFNRGTNPLGAVFVARFVDNDNRENGDATRTQGAITNVTPADSIRYLGETVVSLGSATQFLDKPWLAVDLPRGTATCTINFTNPDGSAGSEVVPAGAVFVSYTDFVTGATGDDHGHDDDDLPSSNTQILFSRSTDCGKTFSLPLRIASNSVNQGSVVVVDPSSAKNTTATVYIAWRRFADSLHRGGIAIAKSTNGGAMFGAPVDVVTFPVACLATPTGAGCPIDQGLSIGGGSFRTNTYPTMAVDDTGRVYVSWSQRQSNGDARIMMSVSANGTTWSGSGAPVDLGLVADDNGNPFTNLTNPSRGHQIMPTLSFNAGKLMLVYYDLRQDHTLGVFTLTPDLTSYIETRKLLGELDPSDANFNPAAVFNSFMTDGANGVGSTLTIRRHTIDLQGAQTSPAAAGSLVVPSFNSFRVSRYQFGVNPFDSTSVAEQLQVNTPNLPLFVSGTQPFIGDYIDVAGAPSFVINNGKWSFNTSPSSNPVFHAVWTDNRDVRPPLDGDWTKYTPPFSASNPATAHTSVFDPTQTVPACADDSRSGMRNQNIYTSRIAPGVFVAAPGNSKTLGFIANTTTLLQRMFAITVQNTTAFEKSFRITIANQPLLADGTLDPAGSASLQQFGPVVAFEDVTVSPSAGISRPIFVQSANPTASVTVNVQEITAPGGTLVANGLQASTTLNPDPTAPAIIDPDNPAIANPAIANAEVYNPAIANPAIANPAIANPAIANPAIANPAIANPAIANPAIVAALNPAIANPAIANPAIANPAIANPAIANQTVTDASYTIVNNGNTVGSYAIKLFGTQPAGTSLQLILSKLYATPGSQNCQLTPNVQNVILVSVPDPIIESADQLGNPELPNSSTKNATLNLRPGETGIVTLRANVGTAAALQDIVNNITPVVVSHAVNTGGGVPPATLAITTANGPLPAGVSGLTYSTSLSFFGGNAPAVWAVVNGALPPGLALDRPTGIISGTPTASGLFSFSVSLTDTSAPTPSVAFRNLSITIAQPLLITTTSLADGVVGASYTQTLSATGGDANYTWSLSSGSLPAGLTLSSSGVISGAPTAATTGTSFTVQVQDTGTPQQTKTQLLSIRIAAPLVVTTAPTLPDAIIGVPYSATLQSGGGTSPVLWSLISGALPPGLQLSTAGVISGTPTLSSASSSTLSPAGTFTVQAKDSASPSQTASILLSLHVAAPLSVGTLTLPDGITGSPYQQTLIASGGTGNIFWTLASGTLPPGLTLSPAGVISGTPTAVNIVGSTFTVLARDSGSPSQSAPRTLILRIAAPLVITTASLPGAKYGVAFSQTLAASGGIPPLKWALAAGSGPLPAGLTLSAAGVLSGTPTASGTFAFTVQVADTATPQQVATKSFSITVASLYTVSFYVQPSDSSPSKQITPAMKVLVVDAQGKGVYGVTVTLSIAVNPGGAVLTGSTVATTGNNGIAIFASNNLNKVGIGYVLKATTNLAGAGTALSNPFSIR
ncbi:MAG: beta strand repeat-containing protein [Terriglobales bacterium]